MDGGDGAARDRREMMARTTKTPAKKFTVTTPAGRELTVKLERGTYWLWYGKEGMGNNGSDPVLSEARLREIDGIIGEVEETGGYMPSTFDAGAY